MTVHEASNLSKEMINIIPINDCDAPFDLVTIKKSVDAKTV